MTGEKAKEGKDDRRTDGKKDRMTGQRKRRMAEGLTERRTG